MSARRTLPSSEIEVVIGSAPSSGSTLLRTLLGRLDGVVSGGELAVMDRPELFDVDTTSLHNEFPTWTSGHLRRTFVGGTYAVFRRAPDFGWEAAELEEMARSCGDWDEVLRQFFAGVREKHGATGWIEKTPGNVFAFHRARTALPQAAFHHVVRDGRDVVASLMRRGHGPFRAASRWMFSVLAGLRQESLPASRRVIYEQLVTEPERTMRDLCAELGTKFDPGCLWPPAGSGPPHIPSWLRSETGPVSSAAIGAYRRADQGRILAHLGAIRLSSEGRDFLAALPGGEERGDPSGVDLLHRLGYLDDEERIPPVSAVDRTLADAEIEEYRRRNLKRGGPVRMLVPTRIG